VEFAEKWCAEHGYEKNDVGWDDTIYWIAERQWREEYAQKLPLFTDPFVWQLKWTIR
jgi:hypothetical protein